MSEVFVSYARASADAARRVADLLRGLGYGVWRDDELPAHRAYSDVIEERLRAAKAVVVLWSADAVRSQWVRAEAEVAREAGTLVQLTLDGSTPPLPFNQIQCADLRGWSGDPTAAGWMKIAASVAELAGRPSATMPAPASAPKPAPAEPLLAVLAFDNLSGDPEMTYFSDGVSEEIQETLARGADLKVIGRTSAMQLRGPDKTVRRAASDLKATHVLDGAVRRAGARVRITAQLIDCASETTLWSNRFDRELTDIFALQDEIAAAVAAALKIAFAPSRRAALIDPEAYDLYLKARGLLQRGLSDPAAMAVAVDRFREAVARAPQFAKAWAELAATIGGAWRSQDFTAATRAEGVNAAERALALDPSQGLAYSALSHLSAAGRWQERDRLLEKALAASPTDPMALSYMGHFASDVGRLHDAERYANRAVALDPSLMIASNWRAVTLMQQGRYADARPLWEHNLARWPESNVIKMNAIRAAELLADWAWLDALAASLETSFVSDAVRDQIAYHRNFRDPDPHFAAARLAAAERTLAETGWVPITQAIALHRMGLTEAAFDLAERSSYAFMFDPEQKGSVSGNINVFGAWNGMIQDPRFVGLCARLGLCAYFVDTDRWPDCADVVPYDFRREARRAAAEASL